MFAFGNTTSQVSRVSPDSEIGLSPDAMAYAWFIAHYKGWGSKKMNVEADKFAELFPGSIFPDNVYYLVGQHHYLKKRCSSAAKVWGKIVKKYPHSNKRIEAEYGFAICKIRMNQKKAGLDLLKKIVKRYPMSQQAKTARLVIQSY